MESNFHLGTLGIVFCFATRPLNGRLESAQPAYFIENPFGIELRFKALEGAINRLTFANDYFRHIFTYFPYFLKSSRAGEAIGSFAGSQILVFGFRLASGMEIP
jgi:hypothetical protein